MTDKSDKSGIKKLIEDIEKHIFPLAKEEAKTLFKEGQREGGGVLARQKGEPMRSYIERRERWWKLLNKLPRML